MVPRRKKPDAAPFCNSTRITVFYAFGCWYLPIVLKKKAILRLASKPSSVKIEVTFGLQIRSKNKYNAHPILLGLPR